MTYSLKKKIIYISGIFSGIFFLFWGSGHFEILKGSKSWSSVAGQVLEAQIDSSMRQSQFSQSSEVFYFPKIAYQYQINGQMYENDQIGEQLKESKNPQEIEEFLSGYIPGGYVTVFYHEDDPDDSRLIPFAETKNNYVFLGLGIFLLISTLGGIREDLFSKKRR